MAMKSESPGLHNRFRSGLRQSQGAARQADRPPEIAAGPCLSLHDREFRPGLRGHGRIGGQVTDDLPPLVPEADLKDPITRPAALLGHMALPRQGSPMFGAQLKANKDRRLRTWLEWIVGR